MSQVNADRFGFGALDARPSAAGLAKGVRTEPRLLTGEEDLPPIVQACSPQQARRQSRMLIRCPVMSITLPIMVTMVPVGR